MMDDPTVADCTRIENLKAINICKTKVAATNGNVTVAGWLIKILWFHNHLIKGDGWVYLDCHLRLPKKSCLLARNVLISNAHLHSFICINDGWPSHVLSYSSVHPWILNAFFPMEFVQRSKAKSVLGHFLYIETFLYMDYLYPHPLTRNLSLGPPVSWGHRHNNVFSVAIGITKILHFSTLPFRGIITYRNVIILLN